MKPSPIKIKLKVIRWKSGTDAKGSSQYDMDLSQKRADAVVNALIKKGVPNKMLKAKGVGAKISYASQNAPNLLAR